MAEPTGNWEDIYTEIAEELLKNKKTAFNKRLYHKTAANLIEAIHKGLRGKDAPDKQTELSLLESFQINARAFSYAKTLTQFKHLKASMFDSDGKPLGFDALRKVVADTGEVFNNAYLATEHQFAMQSAIMANKWHTLDSEYLEFSTVGDDKVREEHAIFDKFTAPKDDPIWKTLYTPLGWNCRCTIIPGVEKGLSKEYDSDWAEKTVEPLVKGTIFDNNAGMTQTIFTKNHPYFELTKTKPNVDPEV